MCNTTDTLGTRIAEKRQAMGYSQEYVAEQLGVSRQAVSKWETDQSAPDTYNLISLASLLGVSVEYIAIGTLPAPTPPPATPSMPPRAPLSTACIVGAICLSVGLLGIVLGILFSVPLAIFSAVCALIGILLLTVKRHPALVVSWTFSIIGILVLTTISGISILEPFRHGVRSGALWLAITIPILFLLVLAIVLTVRTVRKNRRQKTK